MRALTKDLRMDSPSSGEFIRYVANSLNMERKGSVKYLNKAKNAKKDEFYLP